MLSDAQWEKLRAAVDAVCNREVDVVRDRAFQIERRATGMAHAHISIIMPEAVWDLEPLPVDQAEQEEAAPYWLEDPGHGWLVVPLIWLQRYIVVPSTHSYYSRLRGLAYLEEDVDATAMLNALGLDTTKPDGGLALQHRVINDFDDYIRRHNLVRFPA